MTVGFELARTARLTHNQALFRDITERVWKVVGLAGDTIFREGFLCECGSDVCTEHIRITLAQYRQVRESPTTFAVVPDEVHVFADIERVIGRNDGYWVVEKQGAAGQIAKEDAKLWAHRDGGGKHVERLLEKIRVCDAALANLPAHLSDAGRIRLEQAIADVRADADDRLTVLGYNVGDAAS
jgi:hypothetical protein